MTKLMIEISKLSLAYTPLALSFYFSTGSNVSNMCAVAVGFITPHIVNRLNLPIIDSYIKKLGVSFNNMSNIIAYYVWGSVYNYDYTNYLPIRIGKLLSGYCDLLVESNGNVADKLLKTIYFYFKFHKITKTLVVSTKNQMYFNIIYEFLFDLFIGHFITNI